MENGKLGMGNSLCLFGDPAGVVLSWFSAGSQDCEKTKTPLNWNPIITGMESRMECVTSFPLGA